MIQLSKNFTDTEFLPDGVTNTTQVNIIKLHYLAHAILQPLRDSHGAIRVTSGIRTPQHNADIGGATNSMHLFLGRDAAVDIVVLGVASDVNKRLAVFSWLLSKCLYSIGELEWVTNTNHFHIGLPTDRHPRRIFIKDHTQPKGKQFIALPEDPIRCMAEIKRIDKRFSNTLTA